MSIGGRPRKDPAAVRSVKHGAFFTPAEDSLLRERAREAGVTVAELLRAAGLGAPLPKRPHPPSPIAAAQWVELGRLAANLNQLQRSINRGDAPGIPRALVEDTRRVLHDVRRALLGGGGA